MKIFSVLIGVLLMSGVLAQAQKQIEPGAVTTGSPTPSPSSQEKQTATRQSPSRTSPVAVGEMAPDFTLEDFSVENDEWRKVTLSAARDKASVVLVFYRGHW